jgi:hypothetical protein
MVWGIELESDDVSNGDIGELCGFEMEAARASFDHVNPNFGGASLCRDGGG